MRARWMWNIHQMLLSIWYEGIAIPPSLTHITTESQWRSLVLTAGAIIGILYVQKDGRWHNTVNYLGRCLKKPPIAGSRLAHYADNASQSFRYHDHNTGKHVTETLTQREIVSRLKQHIPEKFSGWCAIFFSCQPRVRRKTSAGVPQHPKVCYA